MRKLITLFFGFGLCCSLSAQSNAQNEYTQKFIHHIETMGLVLIEPLEPGMTLYGLSRKYNVSLDSILEKNPDLNPEAIPLGYPVNIPIFSKALSFVQPEIEGISIPVYYRVQPKETLYRISKTYLDVAPEVISALNPRSEQGLSIGQVLHLGWYTPGENSHSPVRTSPVMAGDTTAYTVIDFAKAYMVSGKTMREQKGLAVWKPGDSQSHYYVLHPTARVGSYMEVTNPMLHRTLTAKVAGNIPPGLYQTRVGLVVSPSLARALGILDQQFYARWRFVE